MKQLSLNDFNYGEIDCTYDKNKHKENFNVKVNLFHEITSRQTQEHNTQNKDKTHDRNRTNK